MSSRQRPPSDDPFGSLTKDARAQSQGVHPDVAALGDTDFVMRGAKPAVTVEQAPTEILALVQAGLAAEPERADLWSMRFEMLRALGLREEFAAALRDAWSHPRISRALDWVALSGLWHELAAGAPPPEGVKLPLPRIGGEAAPPSLQLMPEATPQNRRFADLAQTLAGRELTVLGKAYAALRARPGFFEDYWRKVAPLLRRPTPLQLSPGLSGQVGGAARVYLKREDGRPITPEHENAAAHCYVALSLGKTGVITGNDVPDNSLALASVARAFKLRCTIVVRRGESLGKASFTARLRQLGADVEDTPADTQSEDPREGALRRWRADPVHLHLALSPGTGPAPYPLLRANFQALLGHETLKQARLAGDGRPLSFVAAVQAEADSIGFMLPLLGDRTAELFYAEPEPGGIRAWRSNRRLQSYNGALREHVWLRDLDRIQHFSIADTQAHFGREQIAASDRIAVGLEDGRAIALTLLLAQRAAQKRDYIVLIGG